MSVRVRPIPIEEQLRTWNFPLYPINRRVNVRPKSNIHKIPAIEGDHLYITENSTLWLLVIDQQFKSLLFQARNSPTITDFMQVQVAHQK